MKKLSRIMLASAIALGSVIGTSGYSQSVQAAPSVQIQLDGFPLSFPAEPVIIKGTTMVPFRAISEALGITVTWNQASKTIIAVKGNGADSVRVKLVLNNPKAIVNQSAVQLAVAPLSKNGNTLIPLSFFSQQFGAEVGWNQSTRTVSIISPQERLYTLGFYALSSYSDVEKLPSFDAISFGWSRIDEDGNFTVTGKEYQVPKPDGEVTPKYLVESVASERSTSYLMVFSGDTKGELTKVINDADRRKQVISDIISAAGEYSHQGIMLDLEGLGLTTEKTATRESFNTFVRELKQQTRFANLKLSLALHPLNSSYQGYDYSTLGKLADELVIMAYGYNPKDSSGKTKAKPEPVQKVDEAIALALQETTKDKLLLGIDINSENADSVNTLAGLAKRYDLKGIAIWRLGIINDDEWDAIRQSVEFKK